MEARLFEPKGDLTPDLVRDLVAALDEEIPRHREIVVTLRSVTGVRWSALWQLAAAFQSRTGYDLQLRDVAPRLRALFREVGIISGHFVRRSAHVQIMS